MIFRWLAILTLTTTASISHAAICAKIQLRGYVYKDRVEGDDRYFNKKDGIRLRVKCMAPAVTPEDVIAQLSKESSVRNTTGDAVYFEFDDASEFRRVYVITRRPVLQLTFTTKHKRRARLDETQLLIEEAYKSVKGSALRR